MSFLSFSILSYNALKECQYFLTFLEYNIEYFYIYETYFAVV